LRKKEVKNMEFEIDSTATLALIIILALGFTGVVAYAVYQATLPADLTITGEGLAFYSDAQGTQVVSTLHVGDVHNGTSVVKTLYLKNTGNIAKAYSLSSSDLPTGISMSWSRDGYLFSPNLVTAASITFMASNGAPLSASPRSFSLVFTPQ
jgi:hypothetical protein